MTRTARTRAAVRASVGSFHSATRRPAQVAGPAAGAPLHGSLAALVSRCRRRADTPSRAAPASAAQHGRRRAAQPEPPRTHGSSGRQDRHPLQAVLAARRACPSRRRRCVHCACARAQATAEQALQRVQATLLCFNKDEARPHSIATRYGAATAVALTRNDSLNDSLTPALRRTLCATTKSRVVPRRARSTCSGPRAAPSRAYPTHKSRRDSMRNRRG